MTYALSRTAAPATDFLAASAVYDHLRLPTSGSPAAPVDETMVLAYRDAAQAHLDGRDGILGRALITQTWTLKTRRFPWRADVIHRDLRMRLPLPPLQSVASVQYVDTDCSTQTLATSEYTVIAGEDGALVPAYGKTWPSTRDVPEAVTVTFVAGYGDAADDVPGAIRAAGLMLVADLYEQRSAQEVGTIMTVNKTVDRLVSPYRLLLR